MLQNPEHELAKKILEKMSPVDHINAVLKLLPRHYQQEAAMTNLANQFYDYGKLLSDDELLFY